MRLNVQRSLGSNGCSSNFLASVATFALCPPFHRAAQKLCSCTAAVKFTAMRLIMRALEHAKSARDVMSIFSDILLSYRQLAVLSFQLLRICLVSCRKKSSVATKRCVVSEHLIEEYAMVLPCNPRISLADHFRENRRTAGFASSW